MNLKNMFSYYGSKSKIVDYYPPPKHKKIIEPFAGSARYSLKYWEYDITIVDKYDVVINIWKWLQSASEKDVRSLPTLYKGEDIRELNLTEPEKQFLGMLAGVASTSPRWKVSEYASIQNGRKNQLKRIADQLYKIRHWEIIFGNYNKIENKEATWFVDPPYQFGGHAYVENKIDFNQLADWCKTRNGQVIVCENIKATWMDFKPIKNLHGAMSETVEAIWSNHKTNYDAVQQSLQFEKTDTNK